MKLHLGDYSRKAEDESVFVSWGLRLGKDRLEFAAFAGNDRRVAGMQRWLNTPVQARHTRCRHLANADHFFRGKARANGQNP